MATTGKKHKKDRKNSHGTNQKKLEKLYPNLKGWVEKNYEGHSLSSILENNGKLSVFKGAVRSHADFHHFGTETGISFLRKKLNLVEITT